MFKKFINLWLNDLWKMTGISACILLLAAVPILFPFTEQAETQLLIRRICGWLILLSIITSVAQMLCSSVHFFLKMKNARAVAQMAAFTLIWGIGIALFTFIAVEADMPSPYPAEPIRQKEKEATVHEAADHLQGPSTLCTYLETDPLTDKTPTTLYAAENLLKLEQEHAATFARYLQEAPKWAYSANDDTFYSKAGHVVFVDTPRSGIPGLVHAAFRTVSAGEPLPTGYLVISPGAELPQSEEEDKKEIPDLALDLGGKRYLLLAWRGVNNRNVALTAINAAIKEIDTQLAPLATDPTPATIRRLITGTLSKEGHGTELLLSEPSSQFGLYQAEIYTNPGQAGTLIMVIRDEESRQPLVIFSQAAQYSTDPATVFRHDIPLPMHTPESSNRMRQHLGQFTDNAPFFTIKVGESYRYFTVSVEVHFSPAGSPGEHTELLLRRRYNVQAFETPESALPLPPLPKQIHEEADDDSPR